MNQLVIARYDEDLNWIRDVDQDFAIYVYNKGARLSDRRVRDRASCISDCSNLGRESETYLRHILYSSRIEEAFTVFSQGNPFEHSPDFASLLRIWKQWEFIQPLSWRYKQELDIPPRSLLEAECSDFIQGLRIRKERFSLHTMMPLNFIDRRAFGIPLDYMATHGLSMGTNLVAHFLDNCGLNALAGRADRHSIGVFSYGAIFAVRNELLNSLPSEAYVRAWRLSTSHEVHGWMLERIWLHLWGEPFSFVSTDIGKY